ncbi:hypothetical protein KBB96_10550 [Luteolibacter ambystomatis]|uniref:Uncharacterized protein n=1 Tax=Luteolibacter ambystomatis TaxID=2824561 RepID=A0A975G5U5_9BACT|nr:hypothetical protein [Luteolibacter ambystomatis]QUE49311.1 hypothetical protein KBB96_10550 [Luteolibacter ambystomatis]
MARKTQFRIDHTQDGWRVDVPSNLSSTGKRERLFFGSREQASYYAHRMKLHPDLADDSHLAVEAARALSYLEPFGLSLDEAVGMVVERLRGRALPS